MSKLEQLFVEIETKHNYELCIDPSSIEDLERSHGYQFPSDLKAFYRRYESVKLFVY